MADNENLGAPQSRNEALLQNILGANYDLGEPQSRNEALLMKLAGEDVDVDFEPQSRIEALLMEIIDQGGGGVEVEPLSVTENGTYTADEGTAFSPVTVNVPTIINEPLSVTENGTYTAPQGSGYSPVTVNVSGEDILDNTQPTGAITSLKSGSANNGVCYGRTGITSITAPNLQSINLRAFYGCTSLETVNFPEIVGFGGTAAYSSGHNECFRGCTSLKNVYAPKAGWCQSSMFYGCTSLQNIAFPKGFLFRDYAFEGCSNLEKFDMFGATNNCLLGANIFKNCSKLTTVVARRTDGVAQLTNINAFTGTPFASGGTGGTLYVPNDLIASYQSATNWSTILGYANNQIKSIESTHTDPNAPIDLTTHYVDGTPIS